MDLPTCVAIRAPAIALEEMGLQGISSYTVCVVGPLHLGTSGHLDVMGRLHGRTVDHFENVEIFDELDERGESPWALSDAAKKECAEIATTKFNQDPTLYLEI